MPWSRVAGDTHEMCLLSELRVVTKLRNGIRFWLLGRSAAVLRVKDSHQREPVANREGRESKGRNTWLTFHGMKTQQPPSSVRKQNVSSRPLCFDFHYYTPPASQHNNFGLREVASLVDVFEKVPDKRATGKNTTTEMAVTVIEF